MGHHTSALTGTSGSPSSPAATSGRSRRRDDHGIPGSRASSGSPASRPSPSGAGLWFTENDSCNVGSISVNGDVGDVFDTGDYPFGITTGPDGNMWYCVGFGNAIGRVNLLRLLRHHLLLRLRLRRRRRHRHRRRLRLLLPSASTSASAASAAARARPSASLPRPASAGLVTRRREAEDSPAALRARRRHAPALEASRTRDRPASASRHSQAAWLSGCARRRPPLGDARTMSRTDGSLRSSS